ncbi:MAG: anhydro-N-acetylmuramic acid kinase [Magnetococcales bacterium]|nr:anhydro-N-acetylmuramic acid kinase [Magnetococcales bacterium]
MGTIFRSVGLISGTSADGVDAVLLQTDGETVPEVLARLACPYPASLRSQILSLYEPGANELDRLGALDRDLGEFFAQAAMQVCTTGGYPLDAVDVVGSHGQTVRHRPPGFSIQIGSPFMIAFRTGITTVADFRMADMVRGGEGAPLVPLYHRVVFGRSDARVAVVNLGGIANITALSNDGRVVAGDTGPANTLMDHWAERLTGGKDHCDHNGIMASRGRVDETAMTWLLRHPYFTRPFPKSTGREIFGATFLAEFLAAFPHMTAEDRFRTLAQLTIETVAQAAEQLLPPHPTRVVLCGGGADNPVLVQGCQQRLSQSEVISSSDLGVDTAFLEAEAFAWLAVRTLKGLTSNLPEATGATLPAVLGAIYPPAPGHVVGKRSDPFVGRL